MSKRSIDEILSGSRSTFAPSIATEAALDALVLEARHAAGPGTQKTRRRRSVWLVPGAILAAGALTAGAVAADQLTKIETPIAIEYMTDTGVTVSCTAHIEISVFSPSFTEITEYYETADFTTSGTGQRIYEYARVLAGDKTGTPDDLPDSVLWLPGGPTDGGWEPYEGRSAITNAIYDFVLLDVENDFRVPEGDSGWTLLDNDCTGQLH